VKEPEKLRTDQRTDAQRKVAEWFDTAPANVVAAFYSDLDETGEDLSLQIVMRIPPEMQHEFFEIIRGMADFVLDDVGPYRRFQVEDDDGS
jgi:hypothetical protein